jgi:hypothetical protein
MNDHHAPDDRTPFDERDERELEAAIGRLPRAIEPAGDLWPGIAARLGRPEAGQANEAPAAGSAAPGRDGLPGRRAARGAFAWPAWRLAAAAVVVAVLGATGVGLWRLIDGGAEAPERAAAGPGASGSESPVPAAAPAAAEPAGAAAVPAADAFGNRLLAALERKRYALGPDASAAVEADIARLGLAVAELVAALSDHPDEPALYHQLAARQRQEADLLLRLNRL